MELNTNNKIANNIRKKIKNKFRTVKNASIAGGWGEKYLTNLISDLKNKNKYPSIPQLIKIAAICECELKDFFE